MGISFSKRHDYVHNRPQPPPSIQPPTYPNSNSNTIAPLPIQPYNNNNLFPSFSPIPPQTQPPLLPNHNHNYNYNHNYYYNPPPLNITPNHQQYSTSTPYHFNNNYYNNNVQFVNGWTQPTTLLPAPYVDHHNAKKVKNDVNVHKDTITIHNSGDSYLLSFTFDAIIDGSITIFYFAKEGPHCKFTPLYPEIPPVHFPFKKGLGQKFVQPSGTGVDLGFFDIDDLSKPSPQDDVYPLVIWAGASESEPSTPIDERSNEKLVASSSHAQISQAVLERKDGKDFNVKVIKQILWIDGARYELREIFGINSSNETTGSEVDAGKECVICMTEAKNTAVLPCRHMCMCSECAKELRLQSDKCPVCRQPIKELLEIKVDDEESQI